MTTQAIQWAESLNLAGNPAWVLRGIANYSDELGEATFNFEHLVALTRLDRYEVAQSLGSLLGWGYINFTVPVADLQKNTQDNRMTVVLDFSVAPYEPKHLAETGLVGAL